MAFEQSGKFIFAICFLGSKPTLHFPIVLGIGALFMLKVEIEDFVRARGLP